jgi:hypothetical protein
MIISAFFINKLNMPPPKKQATARMDGEEGDVALSTALGSNPVVDPAGTRSKREQQGGAQQKQKKGSVKQVRVHPSNILTFMTPLLRVLTAQTAVQVHQHGQYSLEVQKALSHINDLREGYFAHDPVMAKHMGIMRQGMTPSER